MSALPTVFLSYRDLHPLCRPAHVTRDEDMALIQIDRTSLRVEVAFWVRDHLTRAERTVLRMAYGMSTDLDQPPSDDLLDGRVCDGQPIPSVLQLPIPVLFAQRSA